ncbi:MAG TPA: hypothetical protein VM286_10800 [Candidatus Thermoplasmatota archaeon]|nr:hypothetical protein [Candidatus Thermoplasmatota archaeon]
MSKPTILAIAFLTALACAPAATATPPPPTCPNGPPLAPNGINQCIEDVNTIAVSTVNQATIAAQAMVGFSSNAALYVANTAGGALVAGGNLAQQTYDTALATARSTGDMALHLASDKAQETISFVTCTVFGTPPAPCKSPVPPPR